MPVQPFSCATPSPSLLLRSLRQQNLDHFKDVDRFLTWSTALFRQFVPSSPNTTFSGSILAHTRRLACVIWLIYVCEYLHQTYVFPTMEEEEQPLCPILINLVNHLEQGLTKTKRMHPSAVSCNYNYL